MYKSKKIGLSHTSKGIAKNRLNIRYLRQLFKVKFSEIHEN